MTIQDLLGLYRGCKTEAAYNIVETFHNVYNNFSHSVTPLTKNLLRGLEESLGGMEVNHHDYRFMVTAGGTRCS